MKKLLIVLFVMLLAASGAWAQTWHTANQTSVRWDAVTQNTSGELLTGELTYSLYLANAVTDPSKANPSLVAEGITETRYTITLNVEGKFFAGIKAVRSVDGEIVGESEMSWSDDPLVVFEGNTFGLRYFLPPAGAIGFGIE